MSQELIFNTLHDEVDLYEQLVDALHHQQEQLAGRDGEGLKQTAEEIMALTLSVNECREQRARVLDELFLTNTAEDMETYLSELPQSYQQEACDTWDDLVELVSECKALNETNGQLLNMQQEMTDNLLNRMNLQAIDPAYSSDGSHKKEQMPLYQAHG